MADVKIQDLLSATTVADTDLFIVEDNADTKKITKANLVETLGINGKAPTVHTHSMSQITDYQERTFTPTIFGTTTGGTVTYTNQLGSYTKIGNVVNFSIHLSWTAHSGTGGLRVGGLPFANGFSRSSFSLLLLDMTLTSGFRGIAWNAVNERTIYLFQTNNTNSLVIIPVLPSGTVIISGSYIV